jgi:glutathione synthase/RimK-type ligase-like ATP-grasp enzyme
VPETRAPIGILYEHPEWFEPLFAELERRGLPYTRIPAHEHRYDPAAREAAYSLVVNRVSPSSYLRGHRQAMFFAQQFLTHLERLGVPIVNGSRAYGFELSKARQLDLLASLGLPHPASRVANGPRELVASAQDLEVPLIAKPNVGGSGALMRRFDDMASLAQAAEAGELDGLFEIDGTAILQEYHPPREGSIVRVEGLDNAFLYAIRIWNDPAQGFNLCPADICQPDFCPADAPKLGRRIEAEQPAEWIVEAVLRVFKAAEIDVGGVEYLESERDGRVYFYDINALSNFVTDAPTLVGFDPFVRFVDFLERRLEASSPAWTSIAAG